MCGGMLGALALTMHPIDPAGSGMIASIVVRQFSHVVVFASQQRYDKAWTVLVEQLPSKDYITSGLTVSLTQSVACRLVASGSSGCVVTPTHGLSQPPHMQYAAIALIGDFWGS